MGRRWLARAITKTSEGSRNERRSVVSRKGNQVGQRETRKQLLACCDDGRGNVQTREGNKKVPRAWERKQTRGWEPWSEWVRLGVSSYYLGMYFNVLGVQVCILGGSLQRPLPTRLPVRPAYHQRACIFRCHGRMRRKLTAYLCRYGKGKGWWAAQGL